MKYRLMIMLFLTACGGSDSNEQLQPIVESKPTQTTTPTTPQHPEFGTPLGDPYCSPNSVEEHFITLLTLVQDIANGTGGKQTEVVEQDSVECGYAQQCPTDASGEDSNFPYITCDGVRQSTDTDFAFSPESTYINTIDMLIIFDPNVDTQGLTVEQFVQRELDFANHVFARSNVYIELRVAGIRTQQIGEQENLRTLIYPLGDSRDQFEWVTRAQQDVGADIAFLFLSRRQEPIACGVAYLDGTRGINKTRGITQCYQNTVFQPDYLRYYNRAHETFTHEVGHVLGLAHDIKNAGSNHGIFEYSYGFQQDGVELGTIMSYSNEPFKRFSDPVQREEVGGVSYSIGNNSSTCFGLDCVPQPTTNATEHLNRVRDTMSKLNELHDDSQIQTFIPNVDEELPDICIF